MKVLVSSVVIPYIYIYVTNRSTQPMYPIVQDGFGYHSFLITAAVNSDVVAAPGGGESGCSQGTIHSPPMSAVRTSPALITSNVAPAMLLAMESRLQHGSSDSQKGNVLYLPKMSKHHGSTEDHGRRVCTVGSHDIRSYVSASGLKKSVILEATSNDDPRVWKQAHTDPTLQPGTIPGPPTSAAPMLEIIAPYRLGITMTSNWLGFATSCIELEQTK